MLQVRHAELLAEVVHAIRVASPDPTEALDIEADHRLNRCRFESLGVGARHLRRDLAVCQGRIEDGGREAREDVEGAPRSWQTG